MRSLDIDNQLKQRPFVPLRMYLSDGSYYDIRHPEMAIVSRTVISVGVYGQEDEAMPERIILCDPVHVTRLEPINGKTRPAESQG